MVKITIKLEEVLPNGFLALNQKGEIISYSYSRERTLDLSTASGVLSPWIVRASNFPGYPLYVAKINENEKIRSLIINEKQKKNLLELLKGE